ncbi:hypothetical protein [Pontibacter ruber]|uniref:Uncharacterized protein n=1 Tax=Pontibacter ruber TaxID=1343895 RepID=A0ABW5CYI5_9BACT|nr:hypothetical protein [Pontibacter ruber]
MKRILLVISLLILITIENYAKPEPRRVENNCYYGIENGWYKATVKYYNYNTYTRSTYTLSVKVEYDRVTAIDFGNGGSVHSGYNNSGYLYTGGTLYYQTDYTTGEITSATGRVTITEGNSSITYDISL